MFVFLILLLSFLSISCMETSLGKRKGQELVPVAQEARNLFYGTSTLEGIPDDIKRKILQDVMAGDDTDENAQMDHLIKKTHPCFYLNKKFNRLSMKVFEQLLSQHGSRNPQRIADLINKSASFPQKNGSLARFIKSPCVSAIIFNCITLRITPLMIAVGYNNETGVQLLLDGAKKRGILNQYVNLSRGTQDNDLIDDHEELLFDFHCERANTALHIAADTENTVSLSILKSLLDAGANPNVQNGEQITPLFLAMPMAIEHPFQKIRELYMFGADPKIGPANGSEVPELMVKQELARDELTPRMRQVYNWISLLFQTPREFYDFIVREHEPHNV